MATPARRLAHALFTLGAVLALASCGKSPPSGPGVGGACPGAIPQTGNSVTINNTGRKLSPVGRITTVGNFPTGGALTPDGRFYWAVDSGHGRNDVSIVRVATGAVAQVLPLPGGFGQVVFSRDGARAYVSGQKRGRSGYPYGDTKGDEGDVIHVYEVTPSTGTARELDPIALPATGQTGSGRENSLPPNPTDVSFPVGLAVSPDGTKLVVALNNADQAAIVNLETGTASLVATGAYPFGVAITRDGRFAYVGNEYDGTLTKINLETNGAVGNAIAIGSPRDEGLPANVNAHPQQLLADPKRDRVYVAVTNHDGIAVLNTQSDTIEAFIDLKRPEGYGVGPVALALHPDGHTLYVANSGEDAVAAIAVEPRGLFAQWDVVGKMPTAYYASDVEVTADGCTLVWMAAKGFNIGPNPQYGTDNVGEGGSPYGSYIPDALIGKVGMLALPGDAQFQAFTTLVDTHVRPENSVPPPAATPVHGDCAGGACAPSAQIKYVFYVIRENRTYDQVLGSVPRGNGDPALQVLEDNCGAANTEYEGGNRTHPGCGTTPNAHALGRRFVLLDNFYMNSEVSVDGHVIATGAYATDYAQKMLHINYSGRVARYDLGVFPVSFPPRHFLFDEAVRKGISFRNYGEGSGGVAGPFSNDGRPTFDQVFANSDVETYPNNLFSGCLQAGNPNNPNDPSCTFDAGNILGFTGVPPSAQSRMNVFNLQFAQQVAGCTAATIGTPACGVPRFNLMILPNDHTQGTTPGTLTPPAMIADNDLALGQLVHLVSNSAIWPYAAIFVVEDDSQDGADSVDAHRSPAFVISPYTQRGGATVSTRYDQWSAIRTMELILGMDALSLFDANATPMYDAFTGTPDNTPYTVIVPEQDITELNASSAANAALSAAMPYEKLDWIPQSINDRILWQSVFGAASTPPPPGPNASRAERQRALTALKLFREAKTPAEARRKLLGLLEEADDD